MIRLTYISVLLSLLLISPVQAGVGKIVGLSEAVEADRIHIILDGDKMTGNVIITGCESCPMELKLMARSKIYYKHKILSRKKISKLSGRSGTVFYSKASKRVKKIVW